MAKSDYMRQAGAHARLMRLDRPVGSLLLLWPTLWALWIAGQGFPEPRIVVVFVVGVFVMRSAGCVINDVIDRKYDRHVERTKTRPVTTGEVSVGAALLLFALLCLVALALVLSLNMVTIAYAGAGVLLAASYPFFKRFTHFPQLYLGIAFGWGIPMAFAAHLEYVPLAGWLLLLANVFWAGAYDTFYALVDREDDRRIGIKSMAVIAGRHDRTVIAICQGATLITLAAVGVVERLNNFYFGTLAAAALVFFWHQHVCREDDREKFFQAFVGNNWFGAIVFGGVLLAYL